MTYKVICKLQILKYQYSIWYSSGFNTN